MLGNLLLTFLGSLTILPSSFSPQALVHVSWQEKFVSFVPHCVLIAGRMLAGMGPHAQPSLQLSVPMWLVLTEAVLVGGMRATLGSRLWIFRCLIHALFLLLLDADGNQVLDQGFSKSCVPRNPLDSWLEHSLLVSTPSISDPGGPEMGLCRAFLTSPRVRRRCCWHGDHTLRCTVLDDGRAATWKESGDLSDLWGWTEQLHPPLSESYTHLWLLNEQEIHLYCVWEFIDCVSLCILKQVNLILKAPFQIFMGQGPNPLFGCCPSLSLIWTQL